RPASHEPWKRERQVRTWQGSARSATCRPGAGSSLQRTGDLNLLEHLDLVADAHVVVALHADTAFHAGTDFGHVILEATQGFQLAFEDDHVFAQNADRTVTVHHALGDHAAGDGAELGRTEDVTHLGDTPGCSPERHCPACRSAPSSRLR
ncbi:hypothetical protein BCSJ1_26078, partial [Bacillus cereus SJ1]